MRAEYTMRVVGIQYLKDVSEVPQVKRPREQAARMPACGLRWSLFCTWEDAG